MASPFESGQKLRTSPPLKTSLKKAAGSAVVLLALSSTLAESQSDAEKMAVLNEIGQATATWEARSTQGSRAELVEVERQTRDEKLIVSYNLRVTGLPNDRLYKLVSWPISARLPQTAVSGVSISKESYAICEGLKSNQCKLDPVDPRIRLIFRGVAKAEIIRVGLITTDNKLMALTSVVPDPIFASDKGCNLEAVRVLPTFSMAMIRARGLTPNEEVTWASTSAGESLTSKGTTNARGEIAEIILPMVKGHDHGVDEIALKSSSCSPKVAFEWSDPR